MLEPWKHKRGRSPSFPYIPLDKAIAKTLELYSQVGIEPTPWEEALTLIGHTIKSSGGWQTMSAMKQFGLIEYLHTGRGKEVVVTENGAFLAICLRRERVAA